jgi:hypothetical protein
LEDETLGHFALPAQDLARTYGPGKWNVRYLLHHLVDSETVLYYRIRRVLCEPRQVIWYYDEAAWAKGLNYAEVPLDSCVRCNESSPPSSTTRGCISRRAVDEPVHSRTGLARLR